MNHKYQAAYDALDTIISSRVDAGRYTALGYTSNLDLICDFNAPHFNHLLQKHLPCANLSMMTAADTIQTIDDLLKTIVFYCTNGIGGEVDVVADDIVADSFAFSYGMGGTGVQAAMALSQIGCPSVVHLTDDSKEVCDSLNNPYLYTVSNDETLIHTNKIIPKQAQELHFIIQFKKGDILTLAEQSIEIPCSNRLILTKITVNALVPFQVPYFKWLEENALFVRSNVLSSFNAVVDKGLLKKRLAYVTEHISRYKNNNPKGISFFEDAHYHSDDVKKLCLETLYSFVDIVSMNEEELNYTLKMEAFPVDTEDIVSCVEGARYIQNKFKVRKGIIVHTKDYAMYVGNPLDADIEAGLIYGNLLATAKAKNGGYGTKEQIKEVLELDLSPEGMKNLSIIKERGYNGEVTLVPSKYIDKPNYTIGLGDCFVGGVQLCF